MTDPPENDDSKPLTNIELERLKMYQDTFKHMMTFASGGLVLASGLTGALFLPDQVNVWLLVISIILFALATAFAMFGLFRANRHIDLAIANYTDVPQFAFYLFVSSALMYFGLVFSLFALANVIP